MLLLLFLSYLHSLSYLLFVLGTSFIVGWMSIRLTVGAKDFVVIFVVRIALAITRKMFFFALDAPVFHAAVAGHVTEFLAVLALSNAVCFQFFPMNLLVHQESFPID